MARSLQRLAVLVALTQSGCITSVLWRVPPPFFHACPPEYELVATPIDPVPTGILRAVRAGDGVVHLLCRCSDEIERHYTTVSVVESDGAWPSVTPPHESLPLMRVEAGPLPPGIPLVGAGEQDLEMADRVGEAPSRWTWSSVRFDGRVVVLDDAAGSTHPLARLPESRLVLAPQPWPEDTGEPPRPDSIGYTIGRVLVTPFAFLLDFSLTAIFWPLLVAAELNRDCNHDESDTPSEDVRGD